MVEVVEGRLLLSGMELPPVEGEVTAEVLRVNRAATQITDVSGSGIQGGQAKLTATLTADGAPLAGRNVRFQIGAVFVGRARTNDDGVAVLSGVDLGRIRAGAHAGRVVATFAGDTAFTRNTARGALTVHRFDTTLGTVSASGIFGGTTVLTATLKSNGAPLAKRGLMFHVAGREVGQATTNAQGVATLTGVSLAGLNAGTYLDGFMVTFAGNLNRRGSMATGVLSIGKSFTRITLTGLSQTYDGTNKAATATTTVMGLTPTITYTDQSGNAVASPKDAGRYNVRATLGDANTFGSATGVLDIARAQVTVSGTTAQNKIYDGTNTATINVSGAALAGVAAGDTVTLLTTSATGTFDTKDAGTNKQVAIAGLVLSGTSATNYMLAPTFAAANITPRTISVSGITVAARMYDGTTNATLDTTSATIPEVFPGDNVTLVTSGATGAFLTRDVGTGKPVTIDGLTLSGLNAANYVLGPTVRNGDITRATLGVSGVIASNKVYDGTTAATLDTTSAALTGVVAGEVVTLDTSGATGAFNVRDVGVGLTVAINGLVLGGANADNYVLGPVSTIANITAAPLTVTGITASDKAFDGTTSATIDTSNAALAGVVAGDTVTLNTTNAVGAFDTPDPGVGKTVAITGLTLGGPNAGNYTLTQPTTTASIT